LSRKCWNCIKLYPYEQVQDIEKDSETGLWIEQATGKPHDFKKCWRLVQIKEGKWKEYPKQEGEEDERYHDAPDIITPRFYKNHLASLKMKLALSKEEYIGSECLIDECFCHKVAQEIDPVLRQEYLSKTRAWLAKYPCRLNR